MAARYRMADPRDLGIAGYEAQSDASEIRRKLSDDEVALLRICGRFRPLGDHAAAYIDRQAAALASGGLRALARKWWGEGIKSPDPREIVVGLEALIAEGFLVSDAALVERLQDIAKDSPAGCQITTLGLTTRNRIDCLRRGLVSYIENARQYGRSIECVIIDDSANEPLRISNQEMLATLRDRYDAGVRYAAASERDQFLEALRAESGVAEEVLRFALFGDSRCPITTGASRNCLQLDTVGGAYVLVDDDCVCQMARTPGAEPGLAFASGNDPTESWFYPELRDTLEGVAYEPTDFFGAHGGMLGRPLGALIANDWSAETLDLDRASPDFYRALFERGGRVRATVGGVIGDSGIGSTAYLSIDPRSAGRLAISEDAYHQFVKNRQVFCAATRLSVSEGTFCFAGNLGIDNRELLPPFVPVQRNSDGLFARTLRLCDPAAYLAHPPWGCLHVPETPRRQSLEDYWNDMRRLRFGDVVHLLIGTCPAIDPSAGMAVSLCRLGAHLTELGTLPHAEFEAVTRSEVARTMERLADAPPTDSGLPLFYTELQQKHRAAMRDAVASPEFVIPRDLDAATDDVGALTRDLVKRFGLVLQSWPEIVEATQRLRNSGVRLTREV